MTSSLLAILGAFLQLALLIAKIIQQRQLITDAHAEAVTSLIVACQEVLKDVKASRSSVHGPSGDEFDLDGPHTTILDDTGTRQAATADGLSKLLPGQLPQPEGQPGHSSADTKEQ